MGNIEDALRTGHLTGAELTAAIDAGTVDELSASLEPKVAEHMGVADVPAGTTLPNPPLAPDTIEPGQSVRVNEDGDGWEAYTPGGGGSGGVQWVDLGLIDLVAATMDGPLTLYDMPEGTFLSQIRFTDDPDTVPMDVFPAGEVGNITLPTLSIGTVKSFGWAGFAWAVQGATSFSADSLYMPSNGQEAYGPFAALDTGLADFTSMVLSAAAVGPIQAGLLLSDGNASPNNGHGAGVRVDAITAWAAATRYDSPADNTVATPGILQKCCIVANGTIWVNDGTGGTSGGSAPDFAGNAGASVTDGDDIVWFDTSTAPPTVGKIHVTAEIITLTSP